MAENIFVNGHFGGFDHAFGVVEFIFPHGGLRPRKNIVRSFGEVFSLDGIAAVGEECHSDFVSGEHVGMIVGENFCKHVDGFDDIYFGSGEVIYQRADFGKFAVSSRQNGVRRLKKLFEQIYGKRSLNQSFAVIFFENQNLSQSLMSVSLLVNIFWRVSGEDVDGFLSERQGVDDVFAVAEDGRHICADVRQIL